MALEWDARPVATGMGGTGAALNLRQPSCHCHSVVLTFHQLDVIGLRDAGNDEDRP
jgi:hypothetical protein